MMLPFPRRHADPVDEQLRDIAHQGSYMAVLAHGCAFLLIVLFSLGSLVALSGDALAHIASVGVVAATVPAIISVLVSTLLVVCMDTGMVYAAAMLRIQMARRAESAEMRLHVAVLVAASVLEAGTYCYMAAQYDRPATVAAWILVIARALAAPLFSVYLSMARPLPVGPRDILYQVELATGRGVIRDAVVVANDGSAPLSRKMALYGASAVMVDGDRARLENMISVLQQDAPAIEPEREPEPDPVPPHGRPEDDPTDAEGDTQVGLTPYVAALHIMPNRTSKTQRARGSVPRKTARTGRRDTLRTQAFALLDADPDMSRVELRAALRVRRETASTLYAEWRAGRRRLALVE